MGENVNSGGAYMLKRCLSGILSTVLIISLFCTIPLSANATMAMTSSDALVDILKKMEGFSKKPFWDYAQWTVGYGTKCPDDKLEEYKANGIPRDDAEELLKKELNKAETAINKLATTYGIVFKQHEFDALVSFTYNCGTSWTKEITGYFNTAVRSGDKSNAILYALGLWSTAGGEYILIDRRMCEANMYINGEYRAPNSSGKLYPDNFRWVFLNGNGGDIQYNIYCYDSDNPQAIKVSFNSIPKGTDETGKSFNFKFAGWYTAEGKEVALADASLPRGIQLYAKWVDANGTALPMPDSAMESPIQVMVTATDVNLREGPSTDYNRIGSATNGDLLTITKLSKQGSYTWGKSEKGWIRLDFTNYQKGPVITRQPVSTTTAKNKTATISVEAAGKGLTYQWYVAAAGSKKFSKSSITGPIYTTTMTTANKGRKVYCKITDSSGNSVKSQTATLYLGTTLAIKTQPKNTYAALDKKATIKVAATGSGLKYQWYICENGSNTFEKSSVTTASYSTTMTKDKHGRKLYCVITDKNGSQVRTNTVTLSSSTAFIIQQPQNVVVSAKGEIATVTVTAAGKGLIYQWYICNPGETKFSKSSITKSTYQIKIKDATDGRKLYCRITDSAGNTVTSKTVKVSLDKSTAIVQQPASVMAANGQDAIVKVTARGEGLKYQWYFCHPGSKKFKKSSITTDTYSIKMTDSCNGRKLYCVITDKKGKKLTTETVTLYKDKSLYIVKQPNDFNAEEGQYATATVTVNGEGLKYQWYVCDANAKQYTLSAITTNTYRIKMNAARNGRKIYCRITDAQGNTISSETVILTMVNPARITAQPKNVSVGKGKTAKAVIKATGDGLTYQWYYCNANGKKFIKSSSTTNTYSTKMTTARNGRKVYCVVKDAMGNKVKSKTITLSMK